MAHVLVVDDSPTFRQIASSMLLSAGYEVSEVADGEQALDALRESAWPLAVVLDVVMPRLGGIGVLAAVDEDERLASRHAFLLVTSARQMIPPQAVSDLLARLHVDVLEKPFTEESLLASVRLMTERLASERWA